MSSPIASHVPLFVQLPKLFAILKHNKDLDIASNVQIFYVEVKIFLGYIHILTIYLDIQNVEVFVSILIVFIFLGFNDNPPRSLIVRKCRVNDYLTCCFVRFAQGYPFLVDSKIKSKKDFAENIVCI